MIFGSAKDLYKHPEIYKILIPPLSKAARSFYFGFAKKAKNILYLGSASGREIEAWIKINTNITGVDISRQMIEYCQKRIPHIKFICQDVRRLHLKRHYDLIAAPNRFLHHFPPKQLKLVLSKIKKHLAPKGTFITDCFTPYLPKDKSIKCEIEYIDVSLRSVDKAYNCYDHANQRCWECIERFDLKTNQYLFARVGYWYFYPEQINQVADKSGLRILNFYGGYRNEKFDQDESTDLIYVFGRH